ncbi:MAG TPA: hypothetical protein VFD52_00825 [Clostridia bacterium]|nr:hypothetical protein [Clostridia bacterium]
MIGIGTWSFNVDTMFFKGDAKIKIFDNNGEYGFEVEIPGEDIPEILVKDVKEEGNTLTAVGNISMLKGKDVPISLTFEDDVVNGFLKVPYIGKIKLKDGKKVG